MAERMVQWLRTRLYKFSVLARGRALSSVRASVRRELSDNHDVDSKTREYSASASYDHSSGLCRGGMVNTTVGAVLEKHSVQWHIKRQLYNRWLCWRGRHLHIARQMAVRAVAAQLPTPAETEGAITVHATTEDAAASTEAATSSQCGSGRCSSRAGANSGSSAACTNADTNRTANHWGTDISLRSSA